MSPPATLARAETAQPAAATTPKTVSIAIAGSGGAGAMTTATTLVEAAGQAGWYGYMTRSSGAQIRGGEAAAMVRLSTHPIESHDDAYHVLIAIDWQNVGRFAAEIPLGAKSLLIGEADEGEIPPALQMMGAIECKLPLAKTAEGVDGGRPNMVALGVVAQLIGLPKGIVDAIIQKNLGRKGEGAVRSSQNAVAAGMKLAEALPEVPQLPTGDKSVARWSVTGNELAGLGAIRGGVRFVAAYPITPGTEILEWLAPNLAKVGGTLLQAEDELASVNMIIGGSYAGVPALTATAGPGLALMMESIGLAVASETPIVIVDVMRGGPSTGIPVKSEQSDLNIALYGLHGDAPHIVVAPTSVSDCLFTTQWAVHLAEAMQTPVIVLSDQSLGQTRCVIPKPADVAFIAQRLTATEAPADGPYKRYAVTESGVSPMALPGTPGCQYTADGLEHNEIGTPSSAASDHQSQMDKRLRKVTNFNYGDHWAQIEGSGDTAILTWGSSTGPAREAAARLAAQGVNVKLVSMRLLGPALPDKLAAALAGVTRLLVVEQSHGQQFYRMLRAFHDLPGSVQSFAQPGPLPIRPANIVARILNWS